jgi:hypothetical protein
MQDDAAEQAAIRGPWHPSDPLTVSGVEYPAFDLDGGWVGARVGDEQDGFHLVAPSREALVEDIEQRVSKPAASVPEAEPAPAEPVEAPAPQPVEQDPADLLPPAPVEIPANFRSGRWARAGATDHEMAELATEFSLLGAAGQEALSQRIDSLSDGALRQMLAERRGPAPAAPSAPESPAPAAAPPPAPTGTPADLAAVQAAKNAADAKARAAKS